MAQQERIFGTRFFAFAIIVVAIVGATGSATIVYRPSGAQTTTATTSATSPIVISDLNSSLSCDEIVSPPSYLSASLNTVVSQLMNSSEFKTLSQGRPFQYPESPGPGCAENLLKSTVAIPDFNFLYQDMTQPYTRCGGTDYPSYEINAEVYLVPQGYDISRTQWSIAYLGSNNVTTLCATTSVSQTSS